LQVINDDLTNESHNITPKHQEFVENSFDETHENNYSFNSLPGLPLL
jgi:hypothetical protein